MLYEVCVAVCGCMGVYIGLVQWFVSAFRIFHEPEMYIDGLGLCFSFLYKNISVARARQCAAYV